MHDRRPACNGPTGRPPPYRAFTTHKGQEQAGGALLMAIFHHPKGALVYKTSHIVLDISVSEETSASPEQVLAAVRDVSDERVKVWANSKPQYFQIHEQGPNFVEVTEGFRPPFGRVWERSRYEWEPGTIRQTVIDSNVLTPGSTWELKVSPGGGGSSVEMHLRREFRRSAKGRIASAINHLGGKRMWGWYLRRALSGVEKRSA